MHQYIDCQLFVFIRVFVHSLIFYVLVPIISFAILNTLLLNANYSSANKINSNKNAKHISENNLHLNYLNSRNAKSVNEDACQLNIQCNRMLRKIMQFFFLNIF